MGRDFRVIRSFYNTIWEEDPEKKLFIFAKHCILHQEEPLLEELASEARIRVMNVKASPAGHFGLGVYLLSNYVSGGYSYVNRAVRLSQPSADYAIATLNLFYEIGADELAIPTIEQCVDICIKQQAGLDIAEFFAASLLQYTGDRFRDLSAQARQERVFERQRKRFQK